MRGWTASDDDKAKRVEVSPACAGMDPARRFAHLIERCFPRMCGDGPLFDTEGVAFVKFPPHVRGWTAYELRQFQVMEVSPACAGMDRCQLGVSIACSRFPRMCGDGPDAAAARGDDPVFPPHVRGWTVSAVRRVRPPKVSPACAGMDPGIGLQLRTPAGFPRMCGDGPGVTLISGSNLEFPPHVRGWTRPTSSTTRPSRVSPACAGMDRMDAFQAAPRTRFPRMCGDGPW